MRPVNLVGEDLQRLFRKIFLQFSQVFQPRPPALPPMPQAAGQPHRTAQAPLTVSEANERHVAVCKSVRQHKLIFNCVY